MEKKNAIILIVSGLILALSIGVVYFLVIPARQQAEQQEAQNIQLKAQIDAKKNYYAVIDAKIKSLQAAGWEEKRKSIEVNFTSSPFFIAKTNVFLGTMVTGSGMTLLSATHSPSVSVKTSVQASESEVKISKATAAKEKTAQPANPVTYFDRLQGPVKKTSFNLSVVGTYASFKKLLSDLESQTRIVTVKSVAVGSSELKGAGKKQYSVSTFNMVIDVYSY